MKTRIVYQLDMVALSHLLQKPEDQITNKEMFFVIGIVTRCFSASYRDIAGFSGSSVTQSRLLEIEAEHPEKLPAAYPEPFNYLVRVQPDAPEKA
jgi:hypothetical protein